MIATNQEELDMLLEGENEKVYICTGEKLIIPVNKKAVTFIGINNPEVELENSDVKLFVENNIEFVGLKFKEKDYYTELKARKYFPESLKESYSLHTHKGKFYNGVFYGFTSDKIIICRDSENIEERDVVESLGNTQVNIIAIDADEQKIGILSYTNKNGYIVYELSRTDYAVEKKYDVHIHLQEAYQRNLQNKECTVSLNIKEKTVNLGLSLGHLVLEKDNFPQYLIINYETQEVKNNGYFSLSRGGRYKMKEYGNNIFLLSARDGKIFLAKTNLVEYHCILIKRRGKYEQYFNIACTVLQRYCCKR